MILLVALFLAAVLAEEDHDHHGHSNGTTWESEGYFDVAGNYTLKFERVNGEWEDEHAIVVITPITECTLDGMHAVEPEVDHMWEECAHELEGDHAEDEEESGDEDHHTCLELETNGNLIVGTDAHLIHMDVNSWITTAHFQYTGCVAIFAWPAADEMGLAIADKSGAALDYGDDHDDSDESSQDKAWGDAIAAVFVCLLPVWLALGFLGKVREFLDKNLVYILSFALGMILATAVFHIYPEGMHLIDYSNTMDGDDAEIYAFWTSGAVFLFGIMMFLGIRYSLVGLGVRHEHGKTTDEEKVQNFDENALEVATTEQPKNRWNQITLGILLGDGAHHFVDGIVIGAAFENCSKSFAWTIVFSILIHEVAHTLADVCIILAQGFTAFETALLNFASGIVSLLGCIIVLASDVDSNVQGLLLIFGTSMFVAVSLLDILPETESLSNKQTFWPSVLCFSIGCVIMGLMLLNHEHCEVGDSHEGHGH